MARPSLEGRWAVVTGASSGIGADIARELARRGAKLVLVARRAERLEALASSLHASHGSQCEIVTEDLAVAGAADRLAGTLGEKGIEPFVLVNNAGIGLHGDFLDGDPADLPHLLQLNCIAVLELTLLVAAGMLQRGGGHVMLVSSTGSFIPMPQYAAYSATKAFLRNFGEATWVEWKGSPLHMTVLCPGSTRTGFFDAAGHDAPEENWMMRLLTSDSEPVARRGVEGMLDGDRVVIPGLRNQLIVNAARFLPNGLVLPLAGRAFV